MASGKLFLPLSHFHIDKMSSPVFSIPRLCQHHSNHESHRKLSDWHGWSLQPNVSLILNTKQQAPGIVFLLRFLLNSTASPYSILLFWHTFLFRICTIWAALSSCRAEIFSLPNLRREGCLIPLWTWKSTIGPYAPQFRMHNSLSDHFISSLLVLATGKDWDTRENSKRTSQRL